MNTTSGAHNTSPRQISNHFASSLVRLRSGVIDTSTKVEVLEELNTIRPCLPQNRLDPFAPSISFPTTTSMPSASVYSEPHVVISNAFFEDTTGSSTWSYVVNHLSDLKLPGTSPRALQLVTALYGSHRAGGKSHIEHAHWGSFTIGHVQFKCMSRTIDRWCAEEPIAVSCGLPVRR